MQQISCKSVQIFRNPETIWCQMMSNDGLNLENVGLSHIHLAVSELVYDDSESFIKDTTSRIFPGRQPWFLVVDPRVEV